MQQICYKIKDKWQHRVNNNQNKNNINDWFVRCYKKTIVAAAVVVINTPSSCHSMAKFSTWRACVYRLYGQMSGGDAYMHRRMAWPQMHNRRHRPILL